MKSLYNTIACAFMVLFALTMQAQKTVVTANSYDISDNLDLQAVASIFGDSKDLADFERRLNDPNMRINNLDLNNDGYVDYLRVIEVTEGYSHLIVIQAVLGKDLYQDVATIEVEKNKSRNTVSVQIIGNSYLYGPNYIYEPVYVATPPMYSLFWSTSYRPYYSSWYWGYYPSYYNYYAPYSTPTYIVNINYHINRNNRYVYTNNRYNNNAGGLYSNVRGNYYERTNPNNSFYQRNNGYNNRYDLDSKRTVADYSTRGDMYSRTPNRTEGNYSRNNVRAENVNYSRGQRIDNTTTVSRDNSDNVNYNYRNNNTEGVRSSSYYSRGSVNASDKINDESAKRPVSTNSTVTPSNNNYSRGSSYSTSNNAQRVESTRYTPSTSTNSNYSRSSSNYNTTTPRSNSNSNTNNTYSRSSNSNYSNGSNTNNYSRSSSGSSSSGSSNYSRSSESSSSRSSNYSR